MQLAPIIFKTCPVDAAFTIWKRFGKGLMLLLAGWSIAAGPARRFGLD
jgi:hypothetical protein